MTMRVTAAAIGTLRSFICRPYADRFLRLITVVWSAKIVAFGFGASDARDTHSRFESRHALAGLPVLDFAEPNMFFGHVAHTGF
jgi:hypothetical protein